MLKLGRALHIFLLMFLLLSGCGIGCGGDCDAEGLEVEGEQQSVTRAETTRDGVQVSSIATCEERLGGGHRVVIISSVGERVLVTGTPSRDADVDEGAWLQALRSELIARGAAIHAVGFGTACRSTDSAHYLVTHDWRQVDTLISSVEAKLREDGVRGEVALLVQDELVVCPDVGCSY